MEPSDIVYCICRHYVNDLRVDSKLSNLILGYVRARRFDLLSTCSLHFDWHSHSVIEWRFLRQVEAFFKKNALFADGAKCKAAAESSFLENETACSCTNVRLKRFIADQAPFELRYRRWVAIAQRYISTVLGDYTPFLNDLPSLIKVTPGATAQSSRKNSLPQLKMRMRLYSTPRAAPYLKSIYNLYGFKGLRLRNCHSNRIELVPKNWKTDRTIACEPEGN
jgi:hypothetical protein